MTQEDFTTRSWDAIQQAQKIAKKRSQQQVDTPHLLKGILEIEDSIAHPLLRKVEVDIDKLIAELDKLIKTYPKVEGIDKRFLTDTADKVLIRAKKIKKDIGDDFISIELILLGIVQGTDKTGQLLKSLGVTNDKIHSAIKELRKGKKISTKDDGESYNALKRFAVNLNESAETGKLDPIIGRDEEMRRVLQILSRRKKNNPLLIGEAGVGKTAIIEGIAKRIVDRDVPESLQSKQIYVLDLTAMIAGAKYKGDFEERLKGVIKEVTSSNGEIILFIDEIHTLIGAGGGNGAMDAANILKPALARGDLRTIGATTLDEYQKYFEKDKALVRRFQTVLIEEPSIEDTVSILRGLQERYERYHKIEILDEALIAAVELSSRYIADRYLPDKAIDLIDEAAAKLRLELDSVPEELDGWKRKVDQLEISHQWMAKEKTSPKLKEIKKQIANAKEKRDSINAAWTGEKELIDEVQKVKKKLEDLKLEFERTFRQGDLEKAGEIQNGHIPELNKELDVLEKKLQDLPNEKRFINEEVTANDIAEVVGRWTGVPVARMLKSEREKLLLLEDELHKRLIGQNEAVKAVSDAVRRSRAGMQDEGRPIGSFIFLGPTGVGKTELAKALAEVLFNDENAITRIDMSEYMEKHAVSRLVGAPPGYVGYDEGGQLTEAVRRRPYSIVLLDEIEKAHPDTFNILLQVLDDGQLTDNRGRVANFKNTIIIMTSNMGAEVILENFEDLAAVGEEHRQDILETTKEEVFEALKENMRPEFLNRIDEQVMFLPLTQDEIKKILVLLLRKVEKRLSKKGMIIKINECVLDWLAERGYDPQFGARPMKRVLQKDLIDGLSKGLIGNNFVEGDTIYVDLGKDVLTFSKEPFDPAAKFDPKGDSPAKKKRARRKSKKKEAEVDELKKATEDLNDAVKKVKED